MYINPVQGLKNSFLNFVRYFYDPKVTYTDTIIQKWIKVLIPFILDITATGFVFYLALSGLVFVFPKVSQYIFLGTVYWHIPIIILYLGLIRWFFEDLYNFIRRKK